MPHQIRFSNSSRNVSTSDHRTRLARLLRCRARNRSRSSGQLKPCRVPASLVLVRGNRFALPEKEDVVAGVLQTNPAGFGFVVPELAEPGEKPQDIYIAAANLTECDARAIASSLRIERQSNAGPKDASSASSNAPTARSRRSLRE